MFEVLKDKIGPKVLIEFIEAMGNCTIAIGTTQVAGKQANSIIGTEYEGYVSHSVVVWYLVRPHVRHVCVLLPLVMPHIRHTHLGLRIVISLKVEQLAFGPLVMVLSVLLQ